MDEHNRRCNDIKCAEGRAIIGKLSKKDELIEQAVTKIDNDVKQIEIRLVKGDIKMTEIYWMGVAAVLLGLIKICLELCATWPVV